MSERADALARLRALARTGATAADRRPTGDWAGQADARCELCVTTVPEDHRHLLHLTERRIVCVCEACWALRSGDAEYRPTGMRIVWLDGFCCEEATWASLQIPVGLAFLMRSSVSDSVVAFYPGPAGATEAEVPVDAWEGLVAANPVLTRLDEDGEALAVNRLGGERGQPQYAILPIDRCYELVGLVRTRWEGITGGDALAEVVPEFFDRMRAQASPPPQGALAR